MDLGRSFDDILLMLIETIAGSLCAVLMVRISEEKAHAFEVAARSSPMEFECGLQSSASDAATIGAAANRDFGECV